MELVVLTIIFIILAIFSRGFLSNAACVTLVLSPTYFFVIKELSDQRRVIVIATLVLVHSLLLSFESKEES